MAILSLVSMTFLGSCQSNPDVQCRRIQQAQRDIDPATYKTVVKSETIPLTPAPGYDGPQMFIMMAVQNVPTRGKLGALVRNTVFGGIDPEVYAEKVIADYRVRYQEAGNLAVTEGRALSESWNWEYSETIEGAEITPERAVLGITQWVVVSRLREYYLGGAHGMREKQYFLFDTVNVKKLSPDDLFREDARMTVRRILAARLREFAGIAADAALSQGGFFTDLPDVPENFFLTAGGVGFHWDPAEIAPYVMGPIEVVVSYDELMSTLRPEG
ncbi:MAG: RsiV family protein [Treponema sp.]|nr:RsiV family protein [Treponema sp.]